MNPGDEAATVAFRAVAASYQIITDPTIRSEFERFERIPRKTTEDWKSFFRRHTTMPDIDLTGLDDQYAAAKAPEKGDFDEPPDGTYLVFVEKVALKTAKESGNAYLSWQLRIVGGAYDGRCIFKKSMLQTPKNLDFLKGDLAIAGVVLDKLSQLQPAEDGTPSKKLVELLDVRLEVSKQTKGEFTNVYFRKRLDGKASAEDGTKGKQGDTKATEAAESEPATAGGKAKPKF